MNDSDELFAVSQTVLNGEEHAIVYALGRDLRDAELEADFLRRPSYVNKVVVVSRPEAINSTCRACER